MPLTMKCHLQLHFSALHNLYLEPVCTMVAGSCPQELYLLHSLCCTDLASAWKDNCGTLPVQLQQRRPLDWQDYGCSQDKRNYHCIIAGVEFEKYAIDHEMSNQGNPTRHKAGDFSGNLSLFTTLQPVAASLFCNAQSLLRTILDHGRW